MPSVFRVVRFEHTETAVSVLLRLQAELIGLDPSRLSRHATLLVRRSGEELLRVPALRDSVSLERTAQGRLMWAGAFGIPRGMVAERRWRRLGLGRRTFAWRGDLTFELRDGPTRSFDLPPPHPIPRLELTGRGVRTRRAIRGFLSRQRSRMLELPAHLRLAIRAAVAAAAVAGAVLFALPSRYSATALLVATPLSSQDPALSGLPILTARGASETASFLTARDEVAALPVARLAAQSLGRPWSPRRVTDSITVSSGPSPAIVKIVGTAVTRRGALELTQAYANAALAVRARDSRAAFTSALAAARQRLRALGRGTLSTVTTTAQQVGELAALAAVGDPTLRMARRARIVPSRSLTGKALLVLLAILCGLILGAFAGWAERVSRRRAVATEADVTSLIAAPVLGRLPSAESLVLPTDLATGSVRQTLSGLFTQIGFRRQRPRSIALLSPAPGDGTTTAALALTGYAASLGTFVSLLDLDWLRLTALRRLGIRLPRRSPDTGAWLERIEHTRLTPSLLVSGSLRSPAVRDIRTAFRRARAMTELVIVDTPPLSVTHDAIVVAGMVDAVILVVSLHRTPRPVLEDAGEALRRAGITPTGILIFDPAARKRRTIPARRRRPQADAGRSGRVRPVDASSAGPSASSTHSR